MTAFSPFDNKDYDNMSLPYAFYEISMANSGDRDAKVSLRFVFPEDVKTWAVASDCTGEKTIRKGGTATARLVVAWYDHTDPELAHYKNLYASPQPIAEHGLEVFPQLKHNVMRLADGMRRSSLPHWLQNQVANTLSAIVINSMYKRDGRVAFAEGQWTCFRTMDQMWLARTGVLGAHADEERADSPRHEPHGRGQREGEAVCARGLGRHRAPRLPRHTEVGRPELWLHHLCIRGLPHHGRPRELPQAVAQHEAGRRQDKEAGGAAGQQGVSADLRQVGKLLRRRGQPRPVQRQHIRRGLQDNGGAVCRNGRERQGRRIRRGLQDGGEVVCRPLHTGPRPHDGQALRECVQRTRTGLPPATGADVEPGGDRLGDIAPKPFLLSLLLGGWAIPKAPTTSGRPTCSYTTAGCCCTPGASTNGWPCRKTPTCGSTRIATGCSTIRSTSCHG